jgi:hypothetical protein
MVTEVVLDEDGRNETTNNKHNRDHSLPVDFGNFKSAGVQLGRRLFPSGLKFEGNGGWKRLSGPTLFPMVSAIHRAPARETDAVRLLLAVRCGESCARQDRSLGC